MRRTAIFCLALAAAACARGPKDQFPGAPVVLISIDTLRADHLPAYGYAGVRRRHLDRLRQDAVLFEQRVHPRPPDPARARLDAHRPPALRARRARQRGLPLRRDVDIRRSRASEGAGLRHGRRRLRLRAARRTPASPTASTSTTTGSIAPVGADALGRVPAAGRRRRRPSPHEWLEGVAAAPFFLFLHLYEPHAPYEPPEPFGPATRSAYDGEIAAADAGRGRLLDELRRTGVYDRAIVIVALRPRRGAGRARRGRARRSCCTRGAARAAAGQAARAARARAHG